MNSYNEISRAEFMQFFRYDEKLNELTPDDRVEVFRTILLGSSDLTKELLEAIITDYSVSSLQVIKVEHA